MLFQLFIVLFSHSLQARQQRAAEEAELELQKAAQLAERLNEQIKVDAQRQQLAKERQYKARKRANSEATEVPGSADTSTESFGQEMEMDGVRFNTVKIFHPRRGKTTLSLFTLTVNSYVTVQDCLGTTYLADPVCDDVNVTLPLELSVITFDSHYYTTSQGEDGADMLPHYYLTYVSE